MSATGFATGISTLLSTDATLQAALTTLLGHGVTRVLRGNQPWNTIPTDCWPCWLIEQGDGVAGSLTNDGSDIDGLTIGHSRAGFNSELDIALLWTQPDRETAAAQRATLPTLIAQLMLRNPAAGGVSLARLERWQPDQGVNHPKQIWLATLRAEYPIYRS